jgi:hypothetical protein
MIPHPQKNIAPFSPILGEKGRLTNLAPFSPVLRGGVRNEGLLDRGLTTPIHELD